MMSDAMQTDQTVNDVEAPQDMQILPVPQLWSQVTKALALQSVIPLVVGLSWWFVTAQGMVSPLVIPSPSSVWQALDGYLFSGLWTGDLVATVRATVWSFVLGVIAGVMCGAFLAFLPPLRTALYPYIIAFQVFPKIAVAPLFIIWLGYGDAPKVLVGVTLAFFPVVSASIAGLLDLDQDQHNLMRSIGAKRRQEFRHLRLPKAMSYIFPSLDVAMVVAFLGVVTVEIVGTQTGLGRVITARASVGDTAAVFAILIIMATVGGALYLIVKGAQRILPRSIVPA